MNLISSIMSRDNMVLVCCYTFNHSRYIEDTLNGFIKQETTFPYLCLVIDDASNDEEPKTIQGFLQRECGMENAEVENTDNAIRIQVTHRSNRNCTFVVYLLKENHYSKKISKNPYIQPWRQRCKYEAICEGDDFWIDPLKLQKQVDFMESNPDYCMVHTDFDLIDGNRNHRVHLRKNDVYWPSILYDGIKVGALTALYRIDMLKNTPQYYVGKNWPLGDMPMWIELAKLGKIKYIPEVTAKYRILPESASHSSDINKLISYKAKQLEIRRFYAEKYDIVLPNDGYNKAYFESMIKIACMKSNYEVAKKYFDLAKGYNLLTLRIWYFYLGTKYPRIKKIYKSWRSLNS